MSTITIPYGQLHQLEQALNTFDGALGPIVALCRNEDVCKHLTDTERSIVKEAVESLLGIVNGMDDDLQLVHEYGTSSIDGVVFDPEAAALAEYVALDGGCDQPEQQGTPCPGTCYECTKDDEAEFWADVKAGDMKLADFFMIEGGAA